MPHSPQETTAQTATANPDISGATARNWARLHVSNPQNRLKARANKTRSERLSVPAEYLTHRDNLALVENAVDYIRRHGLPTEDALYSLGLNLLRGCPFTPAARQLVAGFLHENARPADTYLSEGFPYPRDERDFLGAVYQSLVAEGEKNTRGSYFTPPGIVDKMCEGLTVKSDTKILDPCCGSGAFLLHIPGTCPENLEGIDLDPTAVLLAKFNFFARFPQTCIAPPIRQADFLEEGCNTFAENMQGFPAKHAALPAESAATSHGTGYDLIISNPPWGDKKKKTLSGMPFITSRESFSYFLVRAHEHLRPGGQIRFLLPESILNVRQHADIRHYLLGQNTLAAIDFFGKVFSGVTTGCLALTLSRTADPPQEIVMRGRGTPYSLPRDTLSYGQNCVFPLLRDIDRRIISQVERRREQGLSRSKWALGIVTGDNRGKLSPEKRPGMEPIYTGKEVNRYALGVPRNYIFYKREEMQQVADEALYRAVPKLVYKFIGKKLAFALDLSGSLVLNSANILVPSVEKLSVRSLLALLNSELYQYLHLKLFGEIKILQGNLVQLPLPFLGKAEDELLASYVERVGEPGMDEKIQAFIYQFYGLGPKMAAHIRQELHGRLARPSAAWRDGDS